MALILKIINNTYLKQSTQNSSEITNPDDKYLLEEGQEFRLHSWVNLAEDDRHLRVAFLEDSFNGRNTWYVYEEHVEIWEDKTRIFPKLKSIMVKDVASCSTDVIEGLDEQLIQEMNLIVPNVLVSFKDLNVRLDPSVWPLLQPSARWALSRAIRDRGIPMEVNSGYRTIAQQLILYNHYRNGRCGIPLAARPPRSNHQSGLAIDINDFYGWRPYLQRYGWRWLGPSDPVHFDYVGWGTRDIRRISVLAFQRLWNRNNISDRIAEDGLYGWQTESRLQRSYIHGFAVAPPNSIFRVLRLSNPYMQGQDVRIVQQALANQGYSITVDGVYGPGSQAVVKQFQQRNGLYVDGIVGPNTRKVLGIEE